MKISFILFYPRVIQLVLIPLFLATMNLSPPLEVRIRAIYISFLNYSHLFDLLSFFAPDDEFLCLVHYFTIA